MINLRGCEMIRGAGKKKKRSATQICFNVIELFFNICCFSEILCNLTSLRHE